MEKDQRIKESTLNCPSKRLRRRLWAILGGYRWRRSRLVSWCRARLPIVFCPFGDPSMHQRYINLVYNLCLVQFKSHTRSFWCFRWKFLNLYTSYTDKIPTGLTMMINCANKIFKRICLALQTAHELGGPTSFSVTTQLSIIIKCEKRCNNYFNRLLLYHCINHDVN
jgi:hypothetical protein